MKQHLRVKQITLYGWCLFSSSVTGFQPISSRAHFPCRRQQSTTTIRGFFDAAAITLARSSSSSRSQAGSDYEFALLLDCDGVILETEDLHRLSYNAAFEAFNLTVHGEPVEWSAEYYDMLQNTVGGGKPKMWWYFRNTAHTFPQVGGSNLDTDPQQQQKLVDDLQHWKTRYFTALVETTATARPGILDLLDGALADPRIAVGVCSASTKEAALKSLDVTLGKDRVQKLNVCILGDDVSAKKPDPLIYTTAADRLGMPRERCVVVEDSLVGLRAAVAAGMKCIITYTDSTASMDFYGEGALAKMPDLASRGVTLASIFDPLRAHGLDAEILIGLKDPIEVVEATL